MELCFVVIIDEMCMSLVEWCDSDVLLFELIGLVVELEVGVVVNFYCFGVSCVYYEIVEERLVVFLEEVVFGYCIWVDFL